MNFEQLFDKLYSSTWYVDKKNGLRENDGFSKEFPLNGIEIDKLSPGDTVRIMAEPAPTEFGKSANWIPVTQPIKLTTPSMPIFIGNHAFNLLKDSREEINRKMDHMARNDSGKWGECKDPLYCQETHNDNPGYVWDDDWKCWK